VLIEIDETVLSEARGKWTQSMPISGIITMDGGKVVFNTQKWDITDSTC